MFQRLGVLLKNNKTLFFILFLSFSIRILFSIDNIKLLIVDIEAYNNSARTILESGIFSVGAYHPPVYPLFLAFVYKTFGYSFFTVYLIQSLLGTINTLLIYLIGKQVFGKQIGNLSAGLSLLYWPLTLYSGILLSEVVFLFFLLTGIYLFLKGLENHKIVNFALCGLALALSTLTRSINLLFLALVPVVYLLMNLRSYKSVIKNILVFITVFCLTLAPWVIRNYIMYKAFIPVDTVGGLNLYIGNNDRAEGYFVDITKDPLFEVGQNDYENDQILKKAAKEYIFSHPAETFRVTLKRAILFITFDYHEFDWVISRYMEQNSIFKPLYSSLHKIMYLSDILFFILGFLGFRYFLRSRKGIILGGIIIYYFALMSLFYIQARYRIPIMPFMAIAAALFIQKLHIRMFKKA
ncbi:MAG: hypothetical protein K0R31_412 [Clostridiales bacterium]|jgi:4-amino-4-deoxy-L-arabinose transferase-like glycosyltransferase|nr:hypothetical protein [Clostridiales bacterium]